MAAMRRTVLALACLTALCVVSVAAAQDRVIHRSLIGNATAADPVLSGRVTDDLGSGIPFVAVNVNDPLTATTVATATTDLTGNYSVTIPSGTYDVAFQPTALSGLSPFVMHGQVITGDTHLDAVLVPALQFTLSGVVRDWSGSPLAASVSVSSSLGGPTLAYVSTGADGSYSVQLNPGAYYVSVSGRVVGAPGNTLFGLDAQAPVQVGAGTVEDITVPARPFDLTVVDPSGQPVPNATVGDFYESGVAFTDAAGLSWSCRAESYAKGGGVPTDAGGHVLVASCPGASSALLSLSAPSGYVSASLQPAITGSSLTVTMQRSFGVRGVVRDGAGNPIAGLEVNVHNNLLLRRATTAADGSYSISLGVAVPTDVDLSISGDGSTLGLPNGPWSLSTGDGSAGHLHVSGDTVEDITLPTSRVDVTVLDPSGQPVPGTALSLSQTSLAEDANGLSWSGSSQSSASSDASGHAQIVAFTGSNLTINLTPPSPYIPTSITIPNLTNDRSIVVSIQSTLDTTPPVVSVPGNLTSEASGPATPVAFTASANDNRDGPVPVSCAPASPGPFPVGTTTVTCSAKDAHGNTGSNSFMVTVTDTTPPVLSTPDLVVVSSTPTPVNFTASATDVVSGTVVPVCAPASGSVFSPGSTVVTCTAADAAGNSASGQFTVTVAAGSASGTVAAGGSVSTGGGSSPADPVGVMVTSPSAGSVSIVDKVADVGAPAGFVFAGYEAQIEAPPASAAAPLRFEFLLDGSQLLPLGLNSGSVAVWRNGAAVSDCTDPASGVAAPDPCVLSRSPYPAVSGTGARLIVLTSAGSRWNFGGQIDTTPPVIATHSDVTAEQTSPAGAAVTYTSPTAADNVDGNVPVSCTPASGATFPNGTTTVNCSASDAHGNSASTSFHVTVQDTTAPALTVPADITAEATGSAGAAVSYAPTAADAVGVTSFSCSPASGSTFGLGTTTVSCSASDAAGNHSSASFHVTVRDTTAPVVTVPADITTSTSSPAGKSVSYSVSAVDLVDGPVTPSCSPASGSTFPSGTTTVNCTVSDAHGNSASKSFHVTVLITDTTPPVITVPANITVEATGPSGAVVTFTVTATDPDDAVSSLSCTPASGSTFALGTTTVVCTATDTHSNTATKSFTVTVRDTKPPSSTITCAGVPCAAAYNHAVAVSLKATDAGSGIAQIRYTTDGSTPTASSGNLYLAPFTLAVSATVRYRAFDKAGNAEPVNLKTIRIDTTPPVLTVPSSPTVAATSSTGAIVKYTVTATDPDDAVSAISCLPASGSQFPVGDTTVRCTATDTVGNVGTATFVVHVRQPLIGAQTQGPAVDYVPAGLAEAFQLKAGKTGTVTGLSVYLDASSTATKLVAGIYADSNNHPGKLLAQATLTGTPLLAAWNAITLPSVALTSGKPYWVAVLSPSGAGTLRYRDYCCGNKGTAPSETSQQTTLTSLPATWTRGQRYGMDGPLAAWGY